MTDRQQPHPQRCETCKHYQTRFEYGNKKICTLIKEMDALKSELEEMGCMGDVCCRDYLKNEWLARQQEGKP